MSKRYVRMNNSGASDQMPRFNHYVPKFILNNFASAGTICVFDKHTQREFKLPSSRAMGEKDFNNVAFNDAVVVSFEDRFTFIEKQGRSSG
jgi:Protein of unknown function (DUF4238)